jgi:hypothetical protein
VNIGQRSKLAWGTLGGAVDIVLGVSMAPKTVRMVLVEGENADGVTVDQDNFDVTSASAAAAADQVIAAILGTRESAAESGYQVLSSGVTWTDRVEAAALRDALAARKVENVMLVSAFMAAAVLAQAVGNAANCARTALLFVEPTTATLAVVDSYDGPVADVHRQPRHPAARRPAPQRQQKRRRSGDSGASATKSRGACPARAPSAVPAPAPAAPSKAPTPVPQLGPTSAPPQQGPPLHPRGDDHGGGDWIHRHLEERGVPWP